MDVGNPALYLDISDVEENRSENDKRFHVVKEETVLNVANNAVPKYILRRNKGAFNAF